MLESPESRETGVVCRALAVSVVMAAVCGCSESSPGLAFAGQGGAAGSTVVSPAGGAGMGTTVAGAAGSESLGGRGGSTAGVAGAAGSSAGGAGGQAGGGAGGAAGSAGQGGAQVGVADALHGFRLEAPCQDESHFGLDHTDNCDILPEVDLQSYERSLAGEPNVVYDVKLRVRGLMEPNIYVDGALHPPRYYVGGHSSTPDYSAYSITVADPPQTYFFNYSDSTGHFVFVVDTEVVIPMRGGAQVTFNVNGPGSAPNGHGVSNRESVVIPDIAPAPAPFNGQFVQFDVVSATPQAANQ